MMRSLAQARLDKLNTGISQWSMSHDCCMLQMCAPYSALQSYKLKVKMTPGSQRKGRAARQVEPLALQLSRQCMLACCHALKFFADLSHIFGQYDDLKWWLIGGVPR